MLDAQIGHKPLELEIALDGLFFLALFLGVRPGIGVAQFLALFDPLASCPLCLTAISLGLDFAI
jgi:uncharacterized membrane protein